MVTLHTNHGDIVIETFDAKAPATVENFLAYCRSGFYDNTIFHRVIKGFMIQGGGFEPGMNQKPTDKPIKNEADNGVKNERGTLAMARTSDPNSAGSQFFICLERTPHLDRQYTAFGKVADDASLAVVRSIGSAKTGPGDKPLEKIVINKVTVTEKTK